MVIGKGGGESLYELCMLLEVDVSAIASEGDGLKCSRTTKGLKPSFIARAKAGLLPREVAFCHVG